MGMVGGPRSCNRCCRGPHHRSLCSPLPPPLALQSPPPPPPLFLSLAFHSRGPVPTAMLPLLPPMAPAPTGQPSRVRQNYNPHCEAAINQELHASYVYLSVAFYLDTPDMALKHFTDLFLQQSREATEHVESLMQLQNLRGGRLRLGDIRKPDSNRWENGLTALKCALQLDRMLNQSLFNLYQLATEKKDAHLCGFLEHHHLHRQVKSISELGGHVIHRRMLGAPESGLAEYLFDNLTLSGSDKKNRARTAFSIAAG